MDSLGKAFQRMVTVSRAPAAVMTAQADPSLPGPCRRVDRGSAQWGLGTSRRKPRRRGWWVSSYLDKTVVGNQAAPLGGGGVCPVEPAAWVSWT